MRVPQWLQRQSRISELVAEIRRLDPYYQDKSNARVIEDALKAWKHTIARDGPSAEEREAFALAERNQP